MGKSKGATPPPVVDNSGENAAMMAGMAEAMMGGMATMMQADQQQMMRSQQQQMMASLPKTYKAPEIDWTKKQGELSQKVKADYGVEALRRKNSTSTILTSPLLDDEDATTTRKSLLAN